VIWSDILELPGKMKVLLLVGAVGDCAVGGLGFASDLE
jgi:hypothetical protein